LLVAIFIRYELRNTTLRNSDLLFAKMLFSAEANIALTLKIQQ